MSDYVRGLRAKVGHDLLFGPAVACFVEDDAARVLLVRHVEGRWTFPAGAIDPGERPADAARREAWEEAGVIVDVLRILGVYGGPEFRGAYANGDEVAWVTTLFEARIAEGEPHAHDDETAEVLWADAAAIESLPVTPGTRHMIARVREGRPFDEPTWAP